MRDLNNLIKYFRIKTTSQYCLFWKPENLIIIYGSVKKFPLFCHDTASGYSGARKSSNNQFTMEHSQPLVC